MRVLILTCRFPWPPFTGDRLRTQIWIDALADHADVVLIAPRGELPSDYQKVRHIPLLPSLLSSIRALSVIIRDGTARQTVLAGVFDWGDALRRATFDAQPYDAAIVVLSRCDPWINALPSRRTILDAVDSMEVSATERAAANAFPGRDFWSRESVRAAILDRRAASRYDETVVVNEVEATRFGVPASVIGNGVVIQPLSEPIRSTDCAFWGNLAYFANRDALDWLLSELWPKVRKLRPNTTLQIGGAGAPASVREWNGRDGVTIQSPLAHRGDFLRGARIALLPLRFGSGASNKLLEGAEAGCAIVGTTKAFRGFDELAGTQIVDDDPASLAERCAALLDDERRWTAMSREARHFVASAHPRHRTHELMRALIDRAAE